MTRRTKIATSPKVAKIAKVGDRRTFPRRSDPPGIADGLRQAADQLGRVDLQRRSHLQEVEERRIDLPAFEVADIGAVKACEIAQVLLADAELTPPGPHALAEYPRLLGTLPVHLAQSRRAALAESTPNT